MRHQRSIRFSERIVKDIDVASRQRGFSSPTAFICYAVEQELLGRQEALIGAEERIAATLDQVRGDQFRLMRMNQALFAFVDTLTRTFVTCVPEPRADAKPQAVAHAKERYDRLIKSAGRAMVGDAKFVMEDLVTHVEE
jgi:hypothetical protein